MSTTTIGATETELEEHDDEIERVPWGYVRVGDIDIAIGFPPNGAENAKGPGKSLGYLGMIPDGGPPTSPGEMLLEEFLKPLGISQRQLADAIGLPYRQVNGIINERRQVTPAIALRLTRYIGMTVGFLDEPAIGLGLVSRRPAGGGNPEPDRAVPAPRFGRHGRFRRTGTGGELTPMKVYYFSEFPYHEYSDEESLKYPSIRLTFPNSNFDPNTANQLFKRYFDECQYVDELGYDGIMVNEHHSTPSCMNASCNLTAAVLARTTQNARILLLGNILPIHENPVRLAEEIAMIDVISGGRVISGMVRGTGVETVSTNVNPVENRERFEECHDLLIKTWSEPGPFRWEGKALQLPRRQPVDRACPEAAPAGVGARHFQPGDRRVGRTPRLYLRRLPDRRRRDRGAVRDVPAGRR